MFFMLRVHINPLTTNVPHHTETIQLICIAKWDKNFLLKPKDFDIFLLEGQ